MAVPTIHKVTRWRQSGVNANGEASFGDPVEMDLFWIDDEKQARDAKGNEFVAMARVLSDTKGDFALGDRLQLSTLADSDIANSFIVRRVKYVENARRTSKLATAIIGNGKK